MRRLAQRFWRHYKDSGNGVAGAFAAGTLLFVAFLIALYVFTILVARGVLTPATWVWPILNWMLSGWVVVLGGLAFVSLIYPLKYVPNRSEMGKRAFAKAATSIVVAVPVFIVLFVLSFPVFLMLGAGLTEARKDSYECFGRYDEVGQSGLNSVMMPSTSTDIKRYYESGFGYQSCDISCTVGIDDLKSFADAKGYVFQPLEWVPLFSESSVMKELDVDSDDCTNYLYCAARNSEHRVPLPGWGDFGNLTFVYDIRNRRLYASYYD